MDGNARGVSTRFVASRLAALVLAVQPCARAQPGDTPTVDRAAPADSTPADGGWGVAPNGGAETNEPSDTASAASTSVSKVALTIRGGISLGSYEAGANWALLRYLKRNRPTLATRERGQAVDLVAVTGASAGNINTVLSAIAWCQTDVTDRQESATDNVFWSTWVGIGLDELFPRRRTCSEYESALPRAEECSVCTKNSSSAYSPDDGVFSRMAFCPAEQGLLKRMADPTRFLPECSLPLGVTISKEAPETVSGQGTAGLEVETQRFAVLLEAKTTPRGLTFESWRRPGAKENRAIVGNRVYPMTIPSFGEQVYRRSVLDVVEASSAFPVAFGPKRLSYCTQLQEKDGSCSSGDAFQARFFDGGLFDNLPIGLAYALAGKTRGEAQPAKEPFDVVYMDPDNRRSYRTAGRSVVASKNDRGLRYLGRLVSSFISVSRTYELQSSIRFAGIQARPITRYSPIIGERLGAFAAFLAKPFREHDFYVGVYDGMWSAAEIHCEDEPNDRDPVTCLAESVVAQAEQLLLPPEGLYVIRSILRRELRDWSEELPGARSNAVSSWLAESDPVPTTHPVRATFDVLWAPGNGDGFIELVKAIATKLDPKADIDPLFANPELFFADLSRDIALRVLEIEEEDRGLEPVTAGLAFAVHAWAGSMRSPGFYWSLSTIPGWGWDGRGVAHLLPYTVTTELQQGGLELGHMPSLLWSGKHNGWPNGLVLPLRPLSWNRADAEVAHRAGLGLIWLSNHFLMKEVTLGATAHVPWKIDRDYWRRARWGPELGYTGIFGRVHVSTALEWGRDRDDTIDQTVWFRLGVADLNGMTYWAARSL